MADSSFLVTQNIYRLACPDIVVQPCDEHELPKHLDPFLESIEDGVIGIAAIYGSKGRMTTLAISSCTRTLVVTLSCQSTKKSKSRTKRKTSTSPLHRLLSDPKIMKSGFYMDKLSSALFFDHGMHITDAKDLLSLSIKHSRDSLAAIMAVLGHRTSVINKAVMDLFFKEGVPKEKPKVVALQAWVACFVTFPSDTRSLLKNIPSIDTVTIDKKILTVVSKTIRDMDRLVSLRPTHNKHAVENKCTNNSIISNRYKTKINRLTGTQRLHITFQKNGKTEKLQISSGIDVTGRQTKIRIGGKIMPLDSIQSAGTVGREALNAADTSRVDIMLLALQKRILLSQNPFVSTIWRLSNISWRGTSTAPSSSDIYFPSKRELNASQSVAVNTILSNADANRVVLIHGPPGTGKTTVIAAAVTSAMASPDPERTLWLVAQSNVAVKNIAEKLATVDFWAFKIIVSTNFHFDWHEHLYERIEENVIRSDLLTDDVTATSRQLLGSRVILCTLSMLSNPSLATVARLAPLQTVIFDEASQIEIGDYFPVLVKFKATLQKLVFIGDDKQLAPYGTSDIPELESIFEKPHLRKRAVFLDTQYRMPIPIGGFISRNVYSRKLKSQHPMVNPACCRFVDVADGVETSKGHSWTNEQEVKVVLKIGRQLIRLGKSFRIITPYDAQRSLLENSLKRAKLPWEDKCFNIDSFQGNEDDYIIVSVVRTAKLGFLNDMRRVNVMLTRCKAGLIMCTKRVFVECVAAETLVGKLHRSLGDSTWIDGEKVLHKGAIPFI